MTNPVALPGAAVGFPVTLTDAARRLAMTPDAVLDLVRAGCLGAYMAAAHETTERPPLRFDEHGLATLRAALTGAGRESSHARRITETHAVAAGLRWLLSHTAPTDRVAVAVADNRPLLAVDASGTPHAHVRPESVLSAAQEHANAAVALRLLMPDVVPNALTRLGCSKVRGIRPAGEDRKNWRTWWRVPLSIWSLVAEDAMRVDDFPALGGTREEGLGDA